MSNTNLGEFYDWTECDLRANNSETYSQLVAIVEQLIRQDAYMLIAGRADTTASLIMSQLAHRYKLVPSAQTAEILLAEREKV